MGPGRIQGEGMKSSGYLLKTIIVGALGGLLFGFDTAVIAGTTHMLTTTFGLSPGQLGFTVSAALWGTVIGAMFAGIPGEKWGGRETLRVTALLYLVSALGCALAWDWPSLVVFRFIGGLGIGASSVVGPVYLAEMAPAKSRGRLVGIFQINIVIGILLAYLSNYLISLGGVGSSEWRWQFGVAAVPAFLFFVMLFGIPQSPRWLVTKKGRVDEAARVLEDLGNPDGKAELQEIVESARQTSGGADEALFTWKYRVPIFLAVSVAFFNQTAGINAILYYLSDIFMKAGFSQVSGNLQAVAVGLMNLLATTAGDVGDRQVGTEDAVADRIGWDGGVPVRRGGNLLYGVAPGAADLSAGGLYRVLCDLAGSGDLGVHQRSVSEPRAGEGTEPG